MDDSGLGRSARGFSGRSFYVTDWPKHSELDIETTLSAALNRMGEAGSSDRICHALMRLEISRQAVEDELHDLRRHQAHQIS